MTAFQGFENGVLCAKNANWDPGASPNTGSMTADGQLWIGSTDSPNVRAATLTSGTGISIINGPGSITISSTGTAASIETENSTPQFVDVAGVSTIDFGLSNLALGSSLPFLTLGTDNVSYGLLALNSIQDGSSNTATGVNSSRDLVSGSNNCSYGKNSLISATATVENVAIGNSSLQSLTIATGANTAVGYTSLFSLQTGSYNTAIGISSGIAYTGAESSNICIRSNGVIGDNNVIRIGKQGSLSGEQNTCYIAGVVGVTVSNAQLVTIDSTSGQLGVTSVVTPTSITGTANQVLANGTSGSAQTGAITLTLPQDIATTSTPTFSRVFAGVGSASLPGFSFTGQTNYGVYYSSNATFLAANGTGWFSVTSGGISVSAAELRSTGLLSNLSGRQFNITNTSAAGVNNLSASNHWVRFTNTAARTGLLPSTSLNGGAVFILQDGANSAATNNLTMSVNGGVKTINGVTSLLQKANGSSCFLGYDGTNYNILASHRMYSTALGRIVDKNNDGDFTTISSAITAASSGQSIMVRPGTYTENLTMKAGVNLYADPSAPNGTVIISGKVSCSYAGTATISNIQLQTNSDFAVSNSGSSATILYLLNCNVVGSNSVPIEYSNSNSASRLYFYETQTNLTTTGIGLYTSSGVGIVEFNSCKINNDGNSLTLPTFTAGVLKIQDCISKCPIQVSGGGQLNSMANSQIDTSAINITPLTLTTSATHTVYNSGLVAGTAAAINVGSGATLNGYLIGYTSSNGTPLAGSGAYNISSLGTTNTHRNITTTSTNPLYTSEILGTQVWSTGIDTTDSNAWVCSPNATVSHANSSIVCYPTGPVNLPNTPSVRAVRSATATNVTGDGTVYPLVWDTELVDQNSNYNNTTGVFTAPIAGNYHIGFTIAMSGLVNTCWGTITITRSVGIGTILNADVNSMSGFREFCTWNWSTIYDLSAGETVSFDILIDGPPGLQAKTKNIDGDGTGKNELVIALLT